jgi:hypothetical protein
LARSVMSAIFPRCARSRTCGRGRKESRRGRGVGRASSCIALQQRISARNHDCDDHESVCVLDRQLLRFALRILQPFLEGERPLLVHNASEADQLDLLLMTATCMSESERFLSAEKRVPNRLRGEPSPRGRRWATEPTGPWATRAMGRPFPA